MRKVCWFIVLVMYGFVANAQSAVKKLTEAVRAFEKDSQMRHAILGLVVADGKTGKILFERNGQTGLAPASTQKIITSAAAFELLGKDYKYETRLGYEGAAKSALDGNLYVTGSGDPTFGSWRYGSTKDSVILKEFVKMVKRAGIREIKGMLVADESVFSYQAIPDGWIWQDIGNYYGAGAYQLNWKENQYDVILSSGNNVNDEVNVMNDKTAFPSGYMNELKAGARGSGDNAYIYLSSGPGRNMLLRGTIPAGERSFTISGATPNPVSRFLNEFSAALLKDSVLNKPSSGREVGQQGQSKIDATRINYFYTHYSPPLDSINFWFMRRSINLYGEALMKAIALRKTGYGDTDKGVELVRNFWAEQGIGKSAINIIDGSGLSPQNRVTADALVKVLQYAKAKPWHGSFYHALPTFNDMKLKSGSIGGARAFAGYHVSASGNHYTIAIIVNNYTGSSGEIVRKIFRVLDSLK